MNRGVNALGGEAFLAMEGPGDAEPRIVFVNGAIAPASASASGSGSPASDAAVPEALLDASVQAVWPGARPQRARGEQHQSLPVLGIAADRDIKDPDLEPHRANGARFFAEEKLIRHYLSTQYGLPLASE